MNREHIQYANYSKLADWHEPISTTPEKKGKKIKKDRKSGDVEQKAE